jgi:hypothetical protein
MDESKSDDQIFRGSTVVITILNRCSPVLPYGESEVMYNFVVGENEAVILMKLRNNSTNFLPKLDNQAKSSQL